LDSLGINLGYLITFALSFGILFVVLRAWVYEPLLSQLAKRRETIARGLEDARVAADARANAEREANRITSEAQTRAAEIVREATERAGSVEQEVRGQAEREATKARESAMAELEGERNRMLSELRGQVVTLALAATRKLLQTNLDEQRQHALLNEFFSGVRNGKVQLLQGAEIGAAQTAEVTSALPMTAAEQDMVRKEILERVGATASVTFRVDPMILGGLIVRVGDQVVDGSLSGQLEDLRLSMR
jgi:F-type H+-transporting ATPase subunit b